MSDVDSSERYSPPIRMTLEAAGRRFDVAAMGPDHVVLRSPQQLAPMQAVVTVNVDGQEVIRQVSLPEGISPDRKRQPVILINTVAVAKTS